MSNPTDKEPHDTYTDSTQKIPEEMRRHATKPRQRLQPSPTQRQTTQSAATAGTRRPPPAAAPRKRRAAPAHVIDPRVTREGSMLGPLLLGLLLLGILGWLAIRYYTPHIERDLMQRSTTALAEEGLHHTAIITIDGRNATLKGTVATAAERSNAEKVVADTFGIRSVNNQLAIVGDGSSSPAAPRTESDFSLTRNGDAVAIAGTVSHQHYADRLQSATSAAFGADNVTGDIAIDESVTNPGWMDAIDGLLPQLKDIENAALDIADGTMTLSGQSQTDALRDDMGSSAATLLRERLSIDNQIESLQPAAEPLIEPEPIAEPQAEIVTEPEPIAQTPSEPAQSATAEPIATDTQISNPDPDAPTEPVAPEPTPVATTFGMQRVGEKFQLRGTVANEELKATLLQDAQSAFGEDGIIDAIEVDANAADATWLGNVGGSFSQIKNLQHPGLGIGNGIAFLTGTTNSPSKKATIEASMKSALGDDVDFQSNVMAIPDKTASLLIKNTGTELALSGILPPDAATQVRSATSAANPELALVDLIEIDDSVIAPDWADPIATALQAMPEITEPSVTVTDSAELILRGTATSEAAKTSAGDSVTALFSESVSLRNDIIVEKPTIVAPVPEPLVEPIIEPDPVTASELFRDIDLAGIRFESGSAELTSNSISILDQVTNALQLSPQVNLEIGGHTDSRGNYNYNVELSTMRAQTVRNYLLDQGIDSLRLQAAGYGPDRPVASNDTRAGRAINRRIEFTIITGE